MKTIGVPVNFSKTHSKNGFLSAFITLYSYNAKFAKIVFSPRISYFYKLKKDDKQIEEAKKFALDSDILYDETFIQLSRMIDLYEYKDKRKITRSKKVLNRTLEILTMFSFKNIIVNQGKIDFDYFDFEKCNIKLKEMIDIIFSFSNDFIVFIQNSNNFKQDFYCDFKSIKKLIDVYKNSGKKVKAAINFQNYINLKGEEVTSDIFLNDLFSTFKEDDIGLLIISDLRKNKNKLYVKESFEEGLFGYNYFNKIIHDKRLVNVPTLIIESKSTRKMLTKDVAFLSDLGFEKIYKLVEEYTKL